MYDTDQEFTSYKTSPTDEFLPLIQRPELVLWLHPRSIEGGGKVGRWRDDSGKGNHLTPPSEARAPDRILKGLNGHDVISFHDNINRSREEVKYLLNNSLVGFTSVNSFFVVYKFRKAENYYQRILTFGPSSLLSLGNDRNQSFWYSSPNLYTFSWKMEIQGHDKIIQSSASDGWMIRFCRRFATGYAETRSNEAPSSSAEDFRPTTWGALLLAAAGSLTSPSDVDFSEIIFFNDTNIDPDPIFSYLSKKYNIPITA